MKNVVLVVVGVFVLAGVASATDHHNQRVVEKVVRVERVQKAPIVERVVEYQEVPRVKIVERVVVDDYDYGQNAVERVVVREKVQHVQRVEKVRNVQRVEVQKSRTSSRSGLVGRLFGR